MNIPKHSPGPWKQHETEGKIYANVRGPNNQTIADCGSRSDMQAQANARLIAAAPELLAALEGLLANAPAPDKNVRKSFSYQVHRVEASKAIAKALGE